MSSSPAGSPPEPVPVPLRTAVAHPALPVEKLRWKCAEDCLDFTTTDDLAQTEEIIGQERAVDAIRQGLEIKGPGYNIFVAGLTGTGKTSVVRRILREVDRSGSTPGDMCFVHNFKDANRPVYLSFEAGQGRAFKRDVGRMLEALKTDIPRLLASQDFKARRKKLLEHHAAEQQRLLRELQREMEDEGFTLVRVDSDPVSPPEVAYIHEGRPLQLADLRQHDAGVTDERLEALAKKQSELAGRLEEATLEARRIARSGAMALESLRRNHASSLIQFHISDLKTRYRGDKLAAHLGAVQEFLLEHLELLDTADSVERAAAANQALKLLDVNVLVDNSGTGGAPIVAETAPTHKNLFGSIEPQGDSRGDPEFLAIKSGALLDAAGGYLVFNIADAANDPEIWPTLKRTLKSSSLVIQAPDASWPQGGSALKPEAIPLDVKVVVVGDHELYHALNEMDDEFRKIFKVKAEFDSTMQLEQPALESYARFVRNLTRDEGLKPFDRSAVRGVIEHGVRLAERIDKISTRFSDVADVVREASYWAGRNGTGVVSETHVDRAIQARQTRINLMEHKVLEMYLDGTILIDTRGERVGALNGLSLLDDGAHAFGHVVRITAQTSMGRAGIINIEREVELSGKAHSKGVLIIEGFLRSRYAQDKPLSMSASIAFEQSYSNIDGDSASSSEIYALLSSLSGLPIKQGLAVTGSVNQLGEIQPVGSVNEKIEGFFDTCKQFGLTGDQGVLMPHLNEIDLMLRKDVVEAVRAGEFHVYPVRTIDEGLELLTGVEAGERDPDGLYPQGTVNRLVDDRLVDLAEGLREFGESESEGEEEGGRDAD